MQPCEGLHASCQLTVDMCCCPLWVLSMCCSRACLLPQLRWSWQEEDNVTNTAWVELTPASPPGPLIRNMLLELAGSYSTVQVRDGVSLSAPPSAAMQLTLVAIGSHIKMHLKGDRAPRDASCLTACLLLHHMLPRLQAAVGELDGHLCSMKQQLATKDAALRAEIDQRLERERGLFLKVGGTETVNAPAMILERMHGDALTAFGSSITARKRAFSYGDPSASTCTAGTCPAVSCIGQKGTCLVLLVCSYHLSVALCFWPPVCGAAQPEEVQAGAAAAAGDRAVSDS